MPRVEPETIETNRKKERDTRFTIRVLVFWFVYPLLGGLLGLAAAFVLPFGPPLVGGSWGEFAVFVGWGVTGALAGGFLATLHTAFAYWRMYLR